MNWLIISEYYFFDFHQFWHISKRFQPHCNNLQNVLPLLVCTLLNNMFILSEFHYHCSQWHK